MSERMTRGNTERYLRVLGIPPRKPSPEYLAEILETHLWHVPFENISKLFHWKNSGFDGVPDIALFLDGIEKYHLGGTCYSINFHLHQLLLSLGFEAALCGADMSLPDVHLVNIVRMEGIEYLVDCGFAAPFTAPMRLDAESQREIALGEDTYVLLPKNAAGRSRLVHLRNGAEHHGYLVNPKPRAIGEFRDVIASSFRPEATFMSAFVLARFSAAHSIVVRNATLHEYSDEAYRRTENRSLDDLIDAIGHHFSIPPSITRTALDGLPLFTVRL
jgi:arylamine N-acetyltransferase